MVWDSEQRLVWAVPGRDLLREVVQELQVVQVEQVVQVVQVVQAVQAVQLALPDRTQMLPPVKRQAGTCRMRS